MVLSYLGKPLTRLITEVELVNSNSFGIDINEYKIEYGNNTRVLNDKLEIGSPVNKKLKLKLEIIVDRLIEVYILIMDSNIHILITILPTKNWDSHSLVHEAIN